MLSRSIKLLALLVVLAILAACNPNNAQYQTPARGGWDNFRAEAPLGNAVKTSERPASG